MEEKIKKAIEIFNKGGIVIFPTDTAYGIGCRIDRVNSVRKLFKIKRRSKSQPVLALVDSIEMAQNYLMPLDLKARELMEKYWPGALTIVYNCKIAKVPSIVRGGKKTLGVRMPNHPLILKLIKEIGVPILGPSANFHKKKTPYKFTDLDSKLLKLVDYILKENISKLPKPSTVVDCTKKPWRVLREGAVRLDLRPKT